MVNGNDSQNWPVKRFCWKFVVEMYQFRKELKNLTQELEDWEWHENRDLESKVVIDFGRHGDLWNYTSYVKGLWGQFFFLGNGKTSLDLEGHHCQVSKVSQKKDFFFMQQFFYSNHNHCLSIRSPQLSATPCQNSLRLWTVPYARWARHLHVLKGHIELW